MNLVILETEGDVNNYIEKIDENKIIAVDIHAHQLLNKKNISHYLIAVSRTSKLGIKHVAPSFIMGSSLCV